MNKAKKLVQYIRKDIKDRGIQIGFSSNIYRAGRDLEKEIKDTNEKLKNYCSGNGFIFVDNTAITESCLNNSKLHLNKKGTSMLANNIKSSLKDVFKFLKVTLADLMPLRPISLILVTLIVYCILYTFSKRSVFS